MKATRALHIFFDVVTVAFASSEVRVTKDVVYAQGLSCDWENRDCRVLDLKLDVFEPLSETRGLDGVSITSDVVGVGSLRPAHVLVHGGGNVGGSKMQMTKSALFWAAKGFVSFAINYRLEKDKGSYPTVGNKTGRLQWDPHWRSAYPAVRDVKAAIRFVRANHKRYSVDPAQMVISGGSAGATAAVAAGVVFEGDYKDELTLKDDWTLNSTHLNESSAVQVVVSHWASDGEVRLVQHFDPMRRSRYGPGNAPIIEFHGTADTTIPISHATAVQQAYKSSGVDYELVALEGAQHAAWCAQPDPKAAPCENVVAFGKCGHGSGGYCSAMDEYALPFVLHHLGARSRQASQSLLI